LISVAQPVETLQVSRAKRKERNGLDGVDTFLRQMECDDSSLPAERDRRLSGDKHHDLVDFVRRNIRVGSQLAS
jgi:hypothetical protein